MKKLLFIFGIILILLVVISVSVITLSSRPSQQVATSTPVSFPVSGTETTTTTGTSTQSSSGSMPLTTNTGPTVQSRNFINDTDTYEDAVNSGYYYLGTAPSDNKISNDQQYIIEYIANTSYFNISLTQEPLGESRQAAEQYLMKKLGLTQQQLCTLKYDVTTPDDVNSIYASRSLGFDFCPGATALPQ